MKEIVVELRALLRATVEEVKNVAEAALSGDKKAANSPRNRKPEKDEGVGVVQVPEAPTPLVQRNPSQL